MVPIHKHINTLIEQKNITISDFIHVANLNNHIEECIEFLTNNGEVTDVLVKGFVRAFGETEEYWWKMCNSNVL